MVMFRRNKFGHKEIDNEFIKDCAIINKTLSEIENYLFNLFFNLLLSMPYHCYQILNFEIS